MKHIFLFLLLFSTCIGASPLSAQGALQPDGAPAPTMKSLDQIEPRTPISADDLPLTIDQSGVYYFTADIAATGGDNITITASYVTVDLGGFTFSVDQGTAILIHTEDEQTNVTVRNGAIVGYSSSGPVNKGIDKFDYRYAATFVTVDGITIRGFQEGLVGFVPGDTIRNTTISFCEKGLYTEHFYDSYNSLPPLLIDNVHLSYNDEWNCNLNEYGNYNQGRMRPKVIFNKLTSVLSYDYQDDVFVGGAEVRFQNSEFHSFANYYSSDPSVIFVTDSSFKRINNAYSATIADSQVGSVSAGVVHIANSSINYGDIEAGSLHVVGSVLYDPYIDVEGTLHMTDSQVLISDSWQYRGSYYNSYEPYYISTNGVVLNNVSFSRTYDNGNQSQDENLLHIRKSIPYSSSYHAAPSLLSNVAIDHGLGSISTSADLKIIDSIFWGSNIGIVQGVSGLELSIEGTILVDSTIDGLGGHVTINNCEITSYYSSALKLATTDIKDTTFTSHLADLPIIVDSDVSISNSRFIAKMRSSEPMLEGISNAEVKECTFENFALAIDSSGSLQLEDNRFINGEHAIQTVDGRLVMRNNLFADIGESALFIENPSTALIAHNSADRSGYIALLNVSDSTVENNKGFYGISTNTNSRDNIVMNNSALTFDLQGSNFVAPIITRADIPTNINPNVNIQLQ